MQYPRICQTALALLVHAGCGAGPGVEDGLAGRKQSVCTAITLTLDSPGRFSAGEGVTEVRLDTGTGPRRIQTCESGEECPTPVCLPPSGKSYTIILDAKPKPGSDFGEWVSGCVPAGGEIHRPQCTVVLRDSSNDLTVINTFEKLLCIPGDKKECTVCYSGTGPTLGTVNKNLGEQTCESSGHAWSPICVPTPMAATLMALAPSLMHSCGQRDDVLGEWRVPAGTRLGPLGCAAQHGPRKPLVPGKYKVTYSFAVTDGGVVLNTDVYDHTTGERLVSSPLEGLPDGTHERAMEFTAKDCHDIEFRVHYYFGGALRIQSTQIDPAPEVPIP